VGAYVVGYHPDMFRAPEKYVIIRVRAEIEVPRRD
jgi:hypothetical protein